MAEPRRLQFTTIQPSSKKSVAPEPPQTLRLQVTLNHDRCTEISYLDLVKNNNDSNKNAINGDDRDVAESVRLLESKYNKAYNVKKKQLRIKDLVDLGEGYDESDTFIDNSEAYDEIVPDCLTTKFGGFYVNKGVLDFTEVADGDSLDLPLTVHRKKLRKLDSDSEPEDDFIKKTGREKKVKDVLEKSRKRLMNKHNIEGNKKLLKKKKARLGLANDLSNHKHEAAPVKSSEPLEEPSLSVLPVVSQPNTQETEKGAQSIVDAKSESTDKLKADPATQNSVPKLPDNLSDSVLQTIANIKVAATEHSHEGKLKFFTNDVNAVLMTLDTLMDGSPLSERNVVYAHLAAFLPCNKGTLIKRVKRLHVDNISEKIKELIPKLADAINSEMPAQLEQHSLNVSRLTEEKEALSSTTESGETSERKVTCRTKFRWTPLIRQLLCDIVSHHMKRHHLLKIRTKTAEDDLRTFLDSDIKALWPKGWMQTKVLFKESWSAHHQYTNAPKKKTSIGNKLVKKGLQAKDLMTGNHSYAQIPNKNSVSLSTVIGSSSVTTPVSLMTSADTKHNIEQNLLMTSEPQNVGILQQQADSDFIGPYTNPHFTDSDIISAGKAPEHIGVSNSLGINGKTSMQITTKATKKDLKITKSTPSVITTSISDPSDSYLNQFKKFSASLVSTPSPLDLLIQSKLDFVPKYFSTPESYHNTCSSIVTVAPQLLMSTVKTHSKTATSRAPKLKSLLHSSASTTNTSTKLLTSNNPKTSNKTVQNTTLTINDSYNSDMLKDLEYLGSVCANQFSDIFKTSSTEKPMVTSNTSKAPLPAMNIYSTSSQTNSINNLLSPSATTHYQRQQTFTSPKVLKPSSHSKQSSPGYSSSMTHHRQSPKYFSPYDSSINRQNMTSYIDLGNPLGSSTRSSLIGQYQPWTSCADPLLIPPLLGQPLSQCHSAASLPSLSINDISSGLFDLPTSIRQPSLVSPSLVHSARSNTNSNVLTPHLNMPYPSSQSQLNIFSSPPPAHGHQSHSVSRQNLQHLLSLPTSSKHNVRSPYQKSLYHNNPSQ